MATASQGVYKLPPHADCPGLVGRLRQMTASQRCWQYDKITTAGWQVKPYKVSEGSPHWSHPREFKL